MATEVTQQPQHPPGFAAIAVTGAPALDLASLAFSVELPSRGFLQEPGGEPWGTTHTWLRPQQASATPEGIVLGIGPEHSWSLRANVTYLLRLRDAAMAETPPQRLAWKPIRMPSQPPAKLAVSLRLPPEEELPRKEAVVVPGPVPGLVVDPVVVVDGGGGARKSRLAPVLSGLVLLLLLAGAGGWWVFLRPEPEKQAELVKPAEGPLGPQTARAFLQASPAPAASYDEAQRYLRDGSPAALQGALLLLDRAGEAGHGPAETRLGAMYDPDGFSDKTSAMKAPDAGKALLHYQRAAKAEDPEGLFRLGRLLISGRADAGGAGPEQGARSLQRAAALGYAPAQQELDRLKGAAK